MANHGTDPSTRFALMRERIEAMKAIWTREEASYHGTYVDFNPIWSHPKPLQQPYPPILIGGDGPTVTDRVWHMGMSGCRTQCPTPRRCSRGFGGSTSVRRTRDVRG
jgi:alkanesulfonate monooxygenase SsuD/methylene tetrahydromethanopterin reductase-like flavin-dependent oxidoreductase (luciferase family)